MWIRTFSGIAFDLDDPRPEMVVIDDIAVSLARLPRFLGHTFQPYNVAQHSLLVSNLCPEFPLEALLHDAHEAYVGDLTRPCKRLLETYAPGVWKGLEERIQAAIEKRFGLLHCASVGEIKFADDALLVTEARDLLPRGTDGWQLIKATPLAARIEPQPEGVSRDMFLQRFHELIAKRRA